MRLSDVMSKEPSEDYVQVDNFLERNLKPGQFKKINVGVVTLPFYCKRCNDVLSFMSNNRYLMCIGVNSHIVSINTVLKCPRCDSAVPVNFLIESNSETDLANLLPNVRILNRTYKILDGIKLSNEIYGKYSDLIEKANRAYNEGLGAGAVMYLRKIYEQVIIESANIADIEIHTAKGKRRKFSDILKDVDSECSIVPTEFSENRYRLFSDLSNIIHGEYDEDIALRQYPAFYRLVVGILDKIKNNRELMQAINDLEWNEEGGNTRNG